MTVVHVRSCGGLLSRAEVKAVRALVVNASKMMAGRYPLALPLLRGVCPDACAEHRFHPTRRWRADFALPTARILIEVDGGAFTGGRHTRGTGFVKDMEKANAAAVLGWRLLRFTPRQVRSGEFLRTVRAAITEATP